MKRETIMFVDDEINILSSLRRIFRKEDYNVLTCSSGKEALKLLEEQDVQAIIADQRMPEMKGTELLKIVKEKYPTIIRIILSGYSDVGDIAQAIQEGEVYRFLRKPQDLTELRQIVSRVMEQSRLMRRVQGLGLALKERGEKGTYQFKTAYEQGMLKVELNGKEHKISEDQVIGILNSLFNQSLNDLDLDIIGGTLVRQQGCMMLYADTGFGFQVVFELPIENGNG